MPLAMTLAEPVLAIRLPPALFTAPLKVDVRLRPTACCPLVVQGAAGDGTWALWAAAVLVVMAART
jgi:hypothetical protein